MRPFMEGGVGNPAALHSHGLEARASLDGARAKVARLVGGAAAGVIFTASATEANNLAIRGSALRAHGRHMVTSSIEHVSIVNSCRELQKQGWSVSAVPVDREGLLDPHAVTGALREDTALVSVMAANGEIGTLQAVREIGRAARARGVPFHVDGVGVLGRLPFSVDECQVDLLTLSSNDLCGPPGAGVLWVRPDVPLAPIIWAAGRRAAIARAPRICRPSSAWVWPPTSRATSARPRWRA
jgi:cysteine desulfurase